MKKTSNKKVITKTKEIEVQKERELQEIDRIAKMLVRRDLALSEVREKREKELEELKIKTKELEESRIALTDMLENVGESRVALMNILEDAEEAKAEAEQERDKTLAIFENFPEGILFFDEDNNLSSVNSKVRDFLNLDIEKTIGKSIKDLKKNPKLIPLIKILGTEMEEIYGKELELKNNLILEISAIPIMRKKRRVGMLVVLRDITREKTVERLKTEFVSISAHQLRTPLSGIKWTLKMILDGDLGKISEEQREFLLKTYKSNERMIRLINDLLNVTRIEEGRFLYNIKSQNIMEMAQEVVISCMAMAKRKKIKLGFKKINNEIPEAKVDIEKMIIVIQNLVDNAIHYTKPGGKVNVSVEYLKDQNNILILVADTGIGIPKNQQKRIFKRFFRGVSATKMETVGTGLGLFIAKNIVESHGGKIWFESAENKGTTFYFTIPVK